MTCDTFDVFFFSDVVAVGFSGFAWGNGSAVVDSLMGCILMKAASFSICFFFFFFFSAAISALHSSEA